MKTPITVKARAHHGAKSLDLTIPSDIVAEAGLEPGDVFALKVGRKSNRLELTYELVYPTR